MGTWPLTSASIVAHDFILGLFLVLKLVVQFAELGGHNAAAIQEPLARGAVVRAQYICCLQQTPTRDQLSQEEEETQQPGDEPNTRRLVL